MKKKIILIIFIFISILAIPFIDPNYTKGNNNSYYSRENAPEFYGLTKAIIKLGENFSLDNTKFRIFARDFEDGDLSNKINVIFNDVNASEIGNYKIIYEVKDSHNNKTTIEVPIEIKSDLEENYYERTLYSLPSVKNMSLAGTNRGNNHDRQILGFYMEASSKISVKRISGNKDLKLTYLNNDSYMEKDFTIKDEYVDITSENAGVPFIKTIYESDEIIKIAIKEKTTNVYELPYYHYLDNEESFFNKWESLNDSYAVLESEDISIIVPCFDRNKLLNYYSNCFHNLEDFFIYWHKTIEQYDEFLGLSYNPVESIDQNVKTKYFVKANVNGYGSAYYSNDHVGIHSSSVASFFEVNWGGLHEIAHGYQGSLANTLNQSEVSNNILGYYVQTNRDITPYPLNWLGQISAIEQNYQNVRINGGTYDDLNVAGKLYFAINLLNYKNSKETYAEINKIWRRNLQNKENLNTIDTYILAYYNLYKINVVPYFEMWGLEVNNKTKAIVFNGAIPSTLKNVTNIDYIKDELYSLIDYKTLNQYNLKGSLNLSFHIADFREIKGKKLLIQNGQFKKEIIIDNKDITINDLPIGTYQLILPVPKNNIYEYSKYNYIDIIENKETSLTCNYVYENKRNITNDYLFELRGLGDNLFAKIEFSKQSIKINTYATSPHSYFNDTYADIKIYDEENNILYHKNYIGNIKNDAEEKIIDYKTGYRIEIIHREYQSRLIIKNPQLNESDTLLSKNKQQNNKYYVGKYGIYQENEEYKNYLDKIDNYVQKLQEEIKDDLYNKNIFVEEKRYLLLSINMLNNPEKDVYLNKYRDIYNGTKPYLSKNDIEINEDEKINLYQLLNGKDLEDGIFTLNEDNFEYDLNNLNINQPGVYKIPYKIYDTDNNITSGFISLTVNKKIEEEIIISMIKEETSEIKTDEEKKEQIEQEIINKVDDIKKEETSEIKIDENDDENEINKEIKNKKTNSIKVIILTLSIFSLLSVIFIAYKIHFCK